MHAHPFPQAVTRAWTRWRVTGPDGTDIVRTSPRYAYQHVPADAFYAAALARIAAAPHVELRLGEPVITVHEAHDAALVHTAAGILRATHVFDSRAASAGDERAAGEGRRGGLGSGPGSGPGNGARAVPSRTAPRLVQAFAGAVVRTAGPTFDPGCATLMDFTVDQPDHGFAFGYLLPYSPHEALVELAGIAEHAPAPAVLEAALARYAARLTSGAYTARSRESGLIPMDAAPVVRRPSPRVTRIGVAGGMAKPSTGYAFLASQRDTAALARTVQPGRSIGTRVPSPRGPVARWLDHVFLRRLRADPAGAPILFTRLFASADPDALIRFLSDVASARDVARVVAALPPAPFVAEACRMAAA